jgi:hypothetical protein
MFGCISCILHKPENFSCPQLFQDLRSSALKVISFLEKELNKEDENAVVKWATCQNIKFNPPGNHPPYYRKMKLRQEIRR